MRKVWTVCAAAAATLGLLTGCAQRPAAEPVMRPAAVPLATTDAHRLAVPAVATRPAAEADSILAKARLVPVLRYEPGIVTGAGTVVNTDPPEGSVVTVGDTITVIVAGPPPATLEEHVSAYRDRYVGVGLDANGVLVVAVHESADLAAEMARLNALAAGRQFRVRTCSRTWADLTRLQIELSKREFLPGARQMAFATAIDPLACAVRLTIELTDAQVAELTARYKGALVIQKGTVSRLG